MRRSVAGAAVGAVLVAGVASGSGALATHQGSAPRPQIGDSDVMLDKAGADVDSLPAKKRNELEAERSWDRRNAAIAADPERRRTAVKQKEDGDHRARAELGAMETEGTDWPTGIFDDPEAPVPAVDFRGTNRWVGEVDGEFLAIYAGRSGRDSTVGRVVAVWSTASHRGYTLDLTGSGTLRIVAADGAVLTLTDEHDDVHRLDAESGTWRG